MTATALNILCAAGALAEVGVLVSGAYTFFRLRGNTLAEGAAYAIMTTLMGLSLLFQLSFIAGRPWVSLAGELLWCILALRTGLRQRRFLSEAARAVGRVFGAHRWLCAGAAAAALYLGLQAVLIPPTAVHWPHLSRILLCEHQIGYFAELVRANAAFHYPLNSLVLVHHFLRFNTELGLGLFSFLAYLAIACCTYALSRRYAWPATAITVAVMVMSLPRFVLLATAPGSELVSAAAAVFSLLVMYRVVEQPNFADLLLLVLSLLFGISSESLYLALSAILAALAALLVFRRHGAGTWWAMLSNHRLWVAAALVPAVVFSQTWRMLYTTAAGSPLCTALRVPGFPQNADNLKGMLANLCRYLLESLDFTVPLDRLVRAVTGSAPSAWLEGLYTHLLVPLLGTAGAAAPFRIQPGLHETTAWFGPLAFLLVWPAMLYATLRGPRRLKATAVALIAELYLISLIPAWTPLNVRFFTSLMACGGFLVAFMLPPWRLSTTRRHIFQALCLGLLCYAALFNSTKPVLGLHPLQQAAASLLAGDPATARQQASRAIRQSIWQRWWRGRFRYDEARMIFGDQRLRDISRRVRPDCAMTVVFRNPSHLFPFLIHWRRAIPLCGPSAVLPAGATPRGYLLVLESDVPVLRKANPRLVQRWRQRFPGALYRVMPSAGSRRGNGVVNVDKYH